MGPMKNTYAMAGGLMFTAGAIQVLGYAANAESTTGFTVPFLGTVGKLLAPGIRLPDRRASTRPSYPSRDRPCDRSSVSRRCHALLLRHPQR